MKIIFFGTPLFAAKVLEELAKLSIEIVAIVTKPDKPQGRSLKLQPPYVKLFAEKLLPGVPFFQPPKCSTAEFAEILRGFQADLFVVVAYGEIIKQEVLDIPRFGCINVHASLLPNYRGAAPIQRALMNGEKETGISIIQLVREMDAGDILHIEKVPIELDTTFTELEEMLCDAGSRSLLKVLQDFEKGTVSKTAQNHSLATFASKITPEECFIDWKRPALSIHNLIRAVTPHPGAWCFVSVRGQKKRIKILRSACDLDLKINPGVIHQEGKNLAIGTSDGAIWLKEIQLEGKQAMPIHELLNGVPAKDIKFELASC
jgi:methionyl-tRNA formyltransferase